METSITSEMVSQQTIIGDNESLDIEVTNDTQFNLNHSKEQTELEQTKNNLKQAREVYFKYFPSQKMACTKATVHKRTMMGAKTVPQPHQLRMRQKDVGGKMPRIGIKSLSKPMGLPGHKGMKRPQKTKCYHPGTKALREIRQFQKSTRLLIPKWAFLRVVHEILQRES